MNPSLSIEIRMYEPALKEEWDRFTENSRNGTFLLKRDYMEYHADRFEDSSLLFFRKGRLFALLPACKKDLTLSSHAGLTYGGIVSSEEMTAEGMLDIFSALTDWADYHSFREIVYKPIPYIYTRIPAQEDLYALFRFGATLETRLISSVAEAGECPPLAQLRKRGIKKALKHGLEVRESEDFASFWNLLTENLQTRHNASPVHSLEEISRLASLFPENIRLFGAFKGEEMFAGVVGYITPVCFHCQYISASPEGKETGALDLLFDRLMERELAKRRYFDFGTSNEAGGRVLNTGLIHQKEGFGGRAVCYDAYRLCVGTNGRKK